MNGAALLFNGIGLIIYVTFTIGLYKLFEKAGEKGWKAIVPVYNWVVWLKLIGKPVWWVVLILIPVVGVLVLVSIVIDLARAFGKHALKDHAAALLLPFYFFPKVGFDPEVKYLGPPSEQDNLPAKTSLREWGDAILFAGVAALIIRTFFIEAFMIPTSSMERTLMAGDFLFVSKFHYGSRMPTTPLAIPFVHNKVKIGNFSMPSYIGALELPYYRVPGLAEVERNDIVVFNFPAHDIQDLNDGAGFVGAVSMKENYIKRCVAVPGDTFQVLRQQVYINGAPGENPEQMQYEFEVVPSQGSSFLQTKKVPGERLFRWTFPDMEDLGFRPLVSSSNEVAYMTPTNRVLNANANWYEVQAGAHSRRFRFFMPPRISEDLRKRQGITKVDTVTDKPGVPDSRIYPQYNNDGGKHYAHNVDNLGPFVIPAKGMTVELTMKNLSLYFRPIAVYEGHDVRVDNGKVYIDGALADSYTFEMDYYFMMGDNRHNSEDSRFWGFVPENHIVGKPLFVFFSYEKAFGIRWNRIGTKYVH